jgi:hypothetical protein
MGRDREAANRVERAPRRPARARGRARQRRAGRRRVRRPVASPRRSGDPGALAAARSRPRAGKPGPAAGLEGHRRRARPAGAAPRPRPRAPRHRRRAAPPRATALITAGLRTAGAQGLIAVGPKTRVGARSFSALSAVGGCSTRGAHRSPSRDGARGSVDRVSVGAGQQEGGHRSGIAQRCAVAARGCCRDGGDRDARLPARRQRGAPPRRVLRRALDAAEDAPVDAGHGCGAGRAGGRRAAARAEGLIGTEPPRDRPGAPRGAYRRRPGRLLGDRRGSLAATASAPGLGAAVRRPVRVGARPGAQRRTRRAMPSTVCSP